MTLPRLLLVALVLTTLTALTGAVVQVLAREPAPRAVTVPREETTRPAAPGGATGVEALTVLREWDRRRARAWARGDAGALRGLYVPGAVAGSRDVAMLRAWSARGLRVRDMRRQVLAGRVVRHRRDRLALAVTDRLARAVAVGNGVHRALPRAAPSTRTVELVRQRGTWRVAAVRARAQPAR